MDILIFMIFKQAICVSTAVNFGASALSYTTAWVVQTDAVSVVVPFSTYRITTRKHDQKTKIAVHYGLL